MTLRLEKKQITHHAIIDAALELLDEPRSFASLSLREVCKKAGFVPTAFYRHFLNMDELGLALVDRASKTLRDLLRDARRQTESQDVLIRSSVCLFLHFVRMNRRQFSFVVRERFGGSSIIRHAIARERERFNQDLIQDLSQMPIFAVINSDDMQVISQLLVRTVLDAAGEWLEIQEEDTLRESIFQERLIKQVRLILVGSRYWNSKPV